MAHVKKHCTDVNTPDFAAEFMELESDSIQMKSSSFSRKGNPLCLTSAPTSLFNTPQQMQYTQGLEQTIQAQNVQPRKERSARASVTWKERPTHGKSVPDAPGASAK